MQCASRRRASSPFSEQPHEIAQNCRGAMGIAAGVGARRPAVLPPRSFRTHTRRPTPLADLRDRASGCFSNQHWQQPLRIEIPDSKRRVHETFARSATRGWDRGKVRRRPSEVDLGWRRPAERLMWAEVPIVDEAHLDLLQQGFGRQRSQQAQAERVLQRPPQAFDQRDRALLSDRSEPLLDPKPLEPPAEHPAREASPSIRHEMRWLPALLRRPRHEASDLGRRRLLREHPCRQWHSGERIEDHPTLKVTIANSSFTSVRSTIQT